MRGWKMTVRAKNGQVFPTKVLELTDHQVVVTGDFVLKPAMPCELQIVVPPRAGSATPGRSDFSGLVQEAVFAQGAIRLIFRVDSMPEELRRMADEYGMKKTRSAYVTV